MKIGRNQPCSCGSGKKYKKCCSGLSIPTLPEHIGRNIDAFVQKKLVEHKATELIRIKQQGLGRNIISTEFQGRRVVAVGSTIYHSPKWKTFIDFLHDYIKMILGGDWGNQELKKPIENRHPILQWYQQWTEYQKNYDVKEGSIFSSELTGAGYCYFGLAYSLYLMKHNVELQKIYIDRLKNKHLFQGAYFEVLIANCFLRAGFELVLEDESVRGVGGHCEFSVTSKKTGKKYSVEVKARTIKGLLGATQGNEGNDPTNRMTVHLNDALRKPSAGERFIFIDLNAPSTGESKPSWIDKAVRRLDAKEKDLQPNQLAYLFITNFCAHRFADKTQFPTEIFAYGLGIPDFSKPRYTSLIEAFKSEEAHRDAYDIIEALRSYPQIPPTFDGSLATESFQEKKRLIIGEKYDFDSVGVATVTSACVLEAEKKIYASVTTEDGKNLILTESINDDQLEEYRLHRDCYFGEENLSGQNIKNIYERFKWFVAVHKKYPSENILKRCQEDFPNVRDWISMSEEERLLEYCQILCAVMEERKNEAA